MIDRFDKGFFHMRGYTGDDKPDHCAHIGLMADIVRAPPRAALEDAQGRSRPPPHGSRSAGRDRECLADKSDK